MGPCNLPLVHMLSKVKLEVILQLLDNKLGVSYILTIEGDPGSLAFVANWDLIVHSVLDICHAQEGL